MHAWTPTHTNKHMQAPTDMHVHAHAHACAHVRMKRDGETEGERERERAFAREMSECKVYGHLNADKSLTRCSTHVSLHQAEAFVR